MAKKKTKKKVKKKAVKKRKVIIYSTPTCPYCRMAKDFMKRHNVAFKEYDVSVDENARKEMMDKSDQMGVPVIDAGGVIIIGFDEVELRKALKIK
jgi:glutaredoxin-like YruB-family protein